jgi:UDP-3-O-[3-hydroxymyristoyl] glucosamine N-acyltransferase
MIPSFTLTDLIKGLSVKLQGDPACVIQGLRPIHLAKTGDMTFLNNSLYRKYLATTQASAVILTEKDAADWQGNAIITDNPYFIYAKIAAFFEHTIIPAREIHPTAVIGENCRIPENVTIAAHCVIGDNVTLGQEVSIGPGGIIGDGVQIGDQTVLDAKATLYHGVVIGKRCRIASGVVIGCDGFGFANHQGGWHKVPQLGGVVIGDDVDIGANTAIDRGALEDTILENGVKLDNLIQIGHNVRIGANTIIAGCTAIAGSTVIGKNCMIGGASCFAGHINICDQVMITGMTAVTKSINEPGIYSSGIVGAVPNHEFRKNNARFHRLESLMQKVKQLETDLKAIKERG